MKTGTVIDLIPGGLSTVAIIVGCGLCIASVGVQQWRISAKDDKIARLQAEAKNWSGAQDANLATIADLKQRNDSLVKAWTWDQGQAQEAAKRAAAANEKTNAQLAATQAELGEVYARNPKARAWGAAAVDPAVAAKLQGKPGKN